MRPRLAQFAWGAPRRFRSRPLACFAKSSWFVVVAFLALGGVARAIEPPPPAIDAIRVGFAGHYKVGYWTPVEVWLSAGAKAARGDVEIVVPDGDGVPTRVVERGVALSAGAKRAVRLYVKFGRPHAPIAVTWRGGDRAIIAERTFRGGEVPPGLTSSGKSGTPKLILEMGSSVEFGSAIRFSEEGDPEETAVAYLDDPNAWPDRWYGYDGVDFIVLTTGRPQIYSRLSPATLAALDRWLHLGGRMLISVGKHGPELLTPGKPLARFAPGRFVKTLPLRRFGALEIFAGTSEPVESAEAENAGNRAIIDVALLQNVAGKIEAYEGTQPEDLPLVVRSGVGFGETTFVAADLDEPPLAGWKARPELLAVLLGRNPGAALTARGAEPRGEGMQYGYDDLIGQLRAALDRFPGVRLVPFWLVAALAIGYVLLLFPLDYLWSAKSGQGRGAPPGLGFGSAASSRSRRSARACSAGGGRAIASKAARSTCSITISSPA